MRRIVLKIGGSLLFSKKDFQRALAPSLRRFSTANLFLVVGGGELVEVMRTLHKAQPALPMDWMHWQCIKLLDSTLDVGSALTPSIPVFQNWKEVEAAIPSTNAQTQWVAIRSFYSEETLGEYPQELLPKETWETSTDSIAWLLAWRINASELILLKSCEVEPYGSLEEAANAGVVDPELPRLAKNAEHIRVRLEKC